MANKVTYGKGNKSRFTPTGFLETAGLGEYTAYIGHGLNIGGLNMGTAEQVFRIPEGSETIEVMAPGLDLVEVPLDFDPVEVDRPTKTLEYQARQLAERQQAEAEA